jgi:sulfatase maturation enzyme AslB (radical SAM superfamily)
MLSGGKKDGSLVAWDCAAIDHGVAVFPNGKIGPCCQIKAEYLKPVKNLVDSNRFADLKTEDPPDACIKCISDESKSIPSYRQMFNKLLTNTPGLQFVDVRNTNLCNLKCRYCGPHFSNRWAEELGMIPPTQSTDIEIYKDILFTPDLHWMYFTGGEPLINADHWELLESLIKSDYAKNIKLQYNTNLTTVKFKDKNIVDLWGSFKQVSVMVSVDVAGPETNHIRSGSNWNNISKNIELLQKFSAQSGNIKITLSPVLSILNLWSIKSLFEFAQSKNIIIDTIVLTGPDYLALDVVPDQLKSLALEKVKEIEPFISQAKYKYIRSLVENNINQCLFNHTIQHVLLLDQIRNENLFDYLPFKEYAINHILKNYEYQ